jgi:hypothetical protein
MTHATPETHQSRLTFRSKQQISSVEDIFPDAHVTLHRIIDSLCEWDRTSSIRNVAPSRRRDASDLSLEIMRSIALGVRLAVAFPLIAASKKTVVVLTIGKHATLFSK